jgi:dTDP-4-dehydrorhamnose reductase
VNTILVTGKTGQLGHELQHTLAPLGHVVACDRTELDIGDANAIRRKIGETRPAVIVNAAAYTAVDKAEAEPDLAARINGTAPGVIAEEAKRLGALLIHYSTDYVFDGIRATPYSEKDTTNPLSVYGNSKLQGERAIMESGCAHLILRTSWVYSGRGSNFVLTILRLAQERTELAVVDDQVGAPTWARALAETTAAMLSQISSSFNQTDSGIYHLSAAGQISRYDFAKQIISTAQQFSGKKTGWAAIRAISTTNYPLPATRPPHVVLSNDKMQRVFGLKMAGWETQLTACLKDFYLGQRPSTAPTSITSLQSES